MLMLSWLGSSVLSLDQNSQAFKEVAIIRHPQIVVTVIEVVVGGQRRWQQGNRRWLVSRWTWWLSLYPVVSSNHDETLVPQSSLAIERKWLRDDQKHSSDDKSVIGVLVFRSYLTTISMSNALFNLVQL
ncbi:hypothetical protein Nepgr_018406 [Nepenthes gracilis]|uniref:Uncharacterized protein n=1 Tax=Nepenthes gracilis TaxID=150966 RepID=A0AAD3SRB3_NEPGR|nr:hypothetical protein Nepgr_018406 [Nepenthes gracilis]